jgi:hypothetical protein
MTSNDDVREALARIFRDYGVCAEGDDDSILHAQLGDAILAAGFHRLSGTVTDAEVDAAYGVLRGIAPREWARKALEAARAVQNG